MIVSSLRRPALFVSAAVLLLTALLAPAQDAAPADKVLLVVRLPAEAKLLIGNSSTEQTGNERSFLSPALTVGKDYTYELTMTWNEGGNAKQESRTVTVRPGERTVVDFSIPLAKPKVEPKPKPAPKVEPKPEPKLDPVPMVEPRPAAKVEPKPEVKPEAPSLIAAPRTRSFLFTYSATVTGLAPGQLARIWLPVPPSNDDQEVKIEARDLPAEGKIGTEKQYGNQILYVEAKAKEDGTLPLKMVYRVTRKELKGEVGKMADDLGRLARYLEADARVPIEGKPLDLIKGRDLPMDQVAVARVLYDVVNNHMRYSKEGTGWGNGDSVWACDSKYGNCSDFHSLFISLARSQKIPAKFEMGFPLPDKHGAGDIPGYHCWAKFRPTGKGWVPVDISEANKNPNMKEYYFGNLTENRLAFSTGRDLELVPKQDGGPLNFLIYPYVEVNGKPYPGDKVTRKFSYADLTQ